MFVFVFVSSVLSGVTQVRAFVNISVCGCGMDVSIGWDGTFRERERECVCVCVCVSKEVSDVFFSFRSCLENAHKLLPDDLLYYFILPVKIFSLNAWINFAVLTCTAHAPPAVEQ